MGKFGDIELTYNERFVILFSLNNLPSHDMKTAQMFRDLQEPLAFDDISKFNEEYEGDDYVVDFETAPQFLIIIPNALRIFFTRFGFPPPVAQEALLLIDRLDAMASVESPPEPEAPEEPESDEAEGEAEEDDSES